MFKTLFFILLFLNLALVGLLLYFNAKNGFLERVYLRITEPVFGISWSNEFEKQEKIYARQANVVMFGNSITNEGEWHEMLGRADVVNRGISGEMTAACLKRVPMILKLKPKIVFIEIGINDLLYGKPTANAYTNITQIAEIFKQNQVVPVLTLVFPVRYKQEVNDEVRTLNQKILQYCKEKQVLYIDGYQLLEKEGVLDSQFTYDGIHLTAGGYKLWSDAIRSILNQTKI